MNTPLSHRHPLYALAFLAALAVLLLGCAKPQAKTAASASKETSRAVEPPKPLFVKPDRVRGIYLTAWSAGSKAKMDHVFAYLKRNGLNAVVIDVRDAGEVYFKTGIDLADRSGATRVAVRHPDRLIQRLLKEGVYPIARIACFRDNFVPKVRRERAVLRADGSLWKDRAGYTWLDPYNPKNWAYLAKIVDYALNLGFPEIQLDYVRFPSEGKASTMVFPAKKVYAKPGAIPTEVVAAFARDVGEDVRKKHAVFSADIFGIVSSSKSDQGIGQELEIVSAPFDLLCPMVYPSHFHKGEYGIADPNLAPYHIVERSLKDYAKRLPGKPIRPWLQDFSMGSKYGAEQVRLQVKAVEDAGFSEFLLWNAGNVYSEGIGMKPGAGKK